MTGRRFVLILAFLAGLSVSASRAATPVLPLIVQISPTSNITTIIGKLGARAVDSIPGTNIHLIQAPAAIPASTAALLGIQWLELNTSISLPSFVLPGLIDIPGQVMADWYKHQPAWNRIRLASAMPYSTGRGVVVADINSIVDFSHRALKGHLTGGYDFVAGKAAGTALEPVDGLEQSEANMLEQSEANMLEDAGGRWVEQIGLSSVSPAYSHGTLCAGIIAAIAPESMIMPVRAFDDQGSSDLFTIAKAIRWSVQNGAHVINMSFGTSIDSKAIQNAVEFAKTSKVVLVASAGNSNSSAPHYPSGYAGVISTAATDLQDRKAAFSNYGSTIFVDAPGSNIFAPYPGGYYTAASGTSFAAPAVAGTAALIRSLRQSGIADSIAGAAVNIDSANPNYAGQLGKGRVDVLLAVKPQ